MAVFERNGDTVALQSGSNPPQDAKPLNGTGRELRIFNASTNDVYFAVGIGAQTATNTDYVIAARNESFLHISAADDNVAMTPINGAATLYVIRGTVK